MVYAHNIPPHILRLKSVIGAFPFKEAKWSIIFLLGLKWFIMDQIIQKICKLCVKYLIHFEKKTFLIQLIIKQANKMDLRQDTFFLICGH